mgnify:CR=1 FL=1
MSSPKQYFAPGQTYLLVYLDRNEDPPLKVRDELFIEHPSKLFAYLFLIDFPMSPFSTLYSLFHIRSPLHPCSFEHTSRRPIHNHLEWHTLATSLSEGHFWTN